MKIKNYIYPLLAATILMFTAQSCFQDLGNDPAFDYPQEPEEPEPPVDESGLIFEMSFNDGFTDAKSGKSATVVGTPTLTEGIEGKAYTGAADSYLTFNTADLIQAPGSDFSIAFWYKVNATPDRAGIITMGPATAGAAPEAQNNRNAGFRLFREGSSTNQMIKGNVGTGTSDVWIEAPNIDPSAATWIHVAMTISNGKLALYFDGEEVKSADFAGVSWEGCDIISIASGAPRFTEWNHLSDQSLIDELRLYNKALTVEDLRGLMTVKPSLDVTGLIFYAPFNGSYIDVESSVNATKVGEPVFAAGKSGQAYAGATDGYVTYNTAALKEAFGTAYSISFWYKVNATPDRAGIITISADDAAAAPEAKNNRTKGIRIFREASGANQIIKGNVGTGDADVWVDGAAAATVDPAANEWVHVTLTVAPDKAILYLNGVSVKESELAAGVSWTDCGTISIGSGAPYFTEWNHLSDLSLIDELRMYNKTLTVEEIGKIIAYSNN